MSEIHRLLELLQETDKAADRIDKLATEHPDEETYRINSYALHKRRSDLERRLNRELSLSQSDLVEYHIERRTERYPALALARALINFQELVTSVFDAIRSTPKQRYRPSPENVELSTLDFAMALPTGSIVVSLSVENERLLGIKSDLDATFDRVFEILRTRDADGLRELVSDVGVASITKAYAWADNASQFGLDTRISILKKTANGVDAVISKSDALSLKEAIEDQSEENIDSTIVVGELIGIDVSPDARKSYFHIKTDAGQDLEGKLGEEFDGSQNWAVHVSYTATVLRIATLRYATGEERVEWKLVKLDSN
jgi:hypothetical protein